MSLRAIAGTSPVLYGVLCDGPDCRAFHPTTERWPVLAWYEAVLRNGWEGSAGDVLAGRGVVGTFCPDCTAEILART